MSGSFAMVPAEVLATGNGYAIAVYAAIAQHADRKGQAYPSIARLQEITGWSRPTVDKAIKVLCEAGALVKTNRSDKGMKRSNDYRLPLRNGAKSDKPTAEKTPKNQMETTSPTMVTTLETDSNEITDVGNDVTVGTKPRFHEQEPIEQENTPPTPSNMVRIDAPRRDSESVLMERFERWYEHYPKKRSRGQAETTWRKIAPSEELTDQMIAAVTAARKSEDWQQKNGKYIPNPSTWLNAKGWLDDFVMAPAGPVGVDLLPGEVATETSPGVWELLGTDGYKRIVNPEWYGVVFDQRIHLHDGLKDFYRARDAAKAAHERNQEAA